VLISMTKHSKGDAMNAAIYLAGELDSSGKKRAKVEVLRGNPFDTAHIANSSPHTHIYGSGVLAWHKDDNPSNQEIDNALDELEKLMFAGLDPDRYSMSVVKHAEDNGSIHTHFFLRD